MSDLCCRHELELRFYCPDCNKEKDAAMPNGPDKETCPRCDKKGYIPDPELINGTVICPKCLGSGEVEL